MNKHLDETHNYDKNNDESFDHFDIDYIYEITSKINFLNEFLDKLNGKNCNEQIANNKFKFFNK